MNRSFILAMQAGAFIQFILTLAGITSRMSSLVSELTEVLELTWDAVHRIMSTLDVSSHENSTARQKFIKFHSFSQAHEHALFLVAGECRCPINPVQQWKCPRNYPLTFTRTPAFRLHAKIRTNSARQIPIPTRHMEMPFAPNVRLPPYGIFTDSLMRWQR